MKARRFGMVLDETYRLLLHAAFDDGEQAVVAYRAWRERVPLDDMTFSSLRILGQAVQTVRRNGVDDPEFGRIRGALKHTWMRNMLRTRALASALEAVKRSGTEVMVLKAAALMARYPDITRVHMAGDFDILVRPADARKAAAAMLDGGFRTDQARLDAFADEDFDKLHAFAFHYGAKNENIDFHWWPLPCWANHRFVDDLFARSEAASLAGIAVKIPTLEDHLYLTLARPEAWDQDEMFARATEALQILRHSEGRIDWKRMIALCREFHKSAAVLPVLELLKTEFRAPLPNAALTTLRRTCSRLSSWEYAMEQRAPIERTPQDQFVMRAIALLRSHPHVSRSLWWTALRVLPSRDFRHRLAMIAQVAKPPRSAEQVWRRYAKAPQNFSPHAVTFGAGFSVHEPSGRWTDGYSAVMALPVTDGCGARLQVRMHFWMPLIPAKPNATVEICTGRGLSRTLSFNLADRMPAEIIVEADHVEMSGFRGAIIAFKPLDPMRPYDFGMSEDKRLLGISILRAELVP